MNASRNAFAIALGLAAVVAAAPLAAFDRYESGERYMETVATGQPAKARPQVERATPPTSSYASEIDFVKMAIITEDALGRGHKIVWINPPQKKHQKIRDEQR